MRVPAAGSGRVLAAGTPAVIMLTLLGVLSAGCGGATAPATVPSLSAASGSRAATGGSRAAELRAAAQCIRQHGIPGYAEPVLTSSGAVYSDLRSIQDASQAVLNTVRSACGGPLARAQLNPQNEPPAPPQLVEAGVRTAQCSRAHGLPHYADPTANTPYTPGHGFSITGGSIPPGGKLSPGFQEAAHACQRQFAAEIRASTLSSLGQDG